MDLSEKITKQINAGFSGAEIRSNLLADGHTDEEIRKELGRIPRDVIAARKGPNPWSVIWTAILLILALVKIIRLFQ